jgi:hypothetical protein
VDTHSQTANPLAHVRPWLAGGCGGGFSSFAKFFGTTLDDFLSAAFAWDFLAVKLFAGFLLGLAGYAFCGGVIAYFLQARTHSRWAWFLVAAMMTSAGGTALPGLNKLARLADVAPITTAYADEVKAGCDNINNFTVWDGFIKFLGLSPSGYRVVVGSFKNPSEALAFANRVNAENPSFEAFVGDRAPCNDYYPVVVGKPTDSLSKVKQLQSSVQKLEMGANAYISFR